MIRIPNLLKWISSGRGNLFGNLWSSFNLDLTSRPGETRVSPRLMVTTDNLTDQGVTCAFQTFTDQSSGNQYYWAISGKYVWRAISSNGYVTAFAKDTSSGTPSGAGATTSCADDQSDMIPYASTYLLVTTKNGFYVYTASTGVWSTPLSGTPTSSGSHMLCIYGNRIYVTEAGTKVWSTDTGFGSWATSGTNFLNLANGGYPVTAITCLRAASDGIWIPTINQQEDGCYVFKWDGTTINDPNNKYFIPDANGILACIIKDDTPWVIDNNGRLLSFNGGTFVPAKNGQLPIKNWKMLKNPLSSTNNRWIHPNGVAIFDGKINILINNEYNDSSTSIEENLAAGIWEYDPEIGWYHKMSLSAYLQNGGTVSDFGQNRVAAVGALYVDKTTNFTSSSADGFLLAGAQYYSDSSTTKYGIFTNNALDTIQKYGYLVTTRILSPNIEEYWQKLFLRFRKLLTLTDLITVKYRTEESPATEATITWTSTNTFTSTSDLSSYAMGDEVEVIQGTGAGKCAHISTITYSTGTYTVTLDDIFPGVTGTAKARLQHWKKIGSVNGSWTLQTSEHGIGVGDPWIQIKVCLQFTGTNHLFDISLINAIKK